LRTALNDLLGPGLPTRASARRAEVSSAPEKRYHLKPKTRSTTPPAFRIDILYEPYSHPLAFPIHAFTKILRLKTHKP